MSKVLTLFNSLLFLGAAVVPATGGTIDINFNTGVDIHGKSQGILEFHGDGGFVVYFTDDESNGSFGGQAQGVHITNTNYGNIKVGSTTDKVLGAYNGFVSGNNYHSSGIVAVFNQGATLVSFDDTDDDGTLKALFAFDENGVLIGQSAFQSQKTVVVDTVMTGGKLIYSVEFDTLAGPAGGSSDGIYFTIDNFHVEGVDPSTAIPLEPPSTLCAGATCVASNPCYVPTCDPLTGACVELPTTIPQICSVTSPLSNGTYSIGATVPIYVYFNQPVSVTGRPRIRLETGAIDRYADYSHGGSPMVFQYVVMPNDSAVDLRTLSSTILANGGQISANGVSANLTLPVVGSPNSLDGAKDINVDGLGSTTAINLCSWVKQGPAAAGTWTVAPDCASVKQTINGDPTFFISNFNVSSKSFEGKFTHTPSDGDDDMLGFVFGWQDINNFYVFDWKAKDQSTTSGWAYKGARIMRVKNGYTTKGMWMGADGGVSTLAQSKTVGWVANKTYRFRLDFVPGVIDVDVFDDATGAQLFDFKVFDSTFVDGKVGFYNYSQSNVKYEGFTLKFSAPPLFPGSCPVGQTLDVTIVGTGFTALSKPNFGAGIVVNSVRFLHSTALVANITVLPSATPGQRVVSVKTGAAVLTLANPFVVLADGIVVSGTTPGQVHAQAVQLGISVSVPNAVSTKVWLNGLPFLSGGQAVDEGNHDLVIQVTDNLGQVVQKVVSFVIDKADPMITISNVAPGGIYAAPVAPDIVVSDANLMNVSIKLDGVDVNLPFLVTQDGQHTLSVLATDKAGRTASKSMQFTINSPPSPPPFVTYAVDADAKIVSVFWEPSPSADVLYYRLYADLELIAETPDTMATAIGLPLGDTAVYFTLVAVDLLGATSTRVVTVLPALDIGVVDYGKADDQGGTKLTRGYFDRFDFVVVNNSAVPVSIEAAEVSLLSQQQTHWVGSEVVAAIAGGFDATAAELVVYTAPEAADTAKLDVMLSLAGATDGAILWSTSTAVEVRDPDGPALAMDPVLFTKGATTNVELQLTNHGSAAMDVVTAYAGHPTPDVSTAIRNSTETITWAQAWLYDENQPLIGLAKVKTVLPGETWTMPAIPVEVGLSVPQFALLVATVHKIHHAAFALVPDQLWGVGPKLTVPIQINGAP